MGTGVGGLKGDLENRLVRMQRPVKSTDNVRIKLQRSREVPGIVQLWDSHCNSSSEGLHRKPLGVSVNRKIRWNRRPEWNGFRTF